jgi:hypothetical protein
LAQIRDKKKKKKKQEEEQKKWKKGVGSIVTPLTLVKHYTEKEILDL